MNKIIQLIFLFSLFLLELIYFKIADKYDIVDHPNHRSSHVKVTIRGGGIIFSIALLIGALCWGWKYGYFFSGLFLISLISFLDDIKPVSNKTRILFHLAAVSILFIQLNIYNLPFYWVPLAFIFVIGTINAVNFMDGINGITGAYSLLTILTLYYINKNVFVFIDNKYVVLVIISLLVFNFFNFRIKARCFAGDVGSVSIAFIIIFFLLQLIIKTNNLNYVLLLLIYGLDTATTVLFRLLRKENVFKAHRSHFYQFLVNEKKIPHLMVTTLYVILQGVINLFILSFSNLSLLSMLIILIIAAGLFIVTRLYFEGVKRLSSL